MLRTVLMILTTGSLLLANAGTLLGTTDSPGITDKEREIRKKLHIPLEAPFVLILVRIYQASNSKTPLDLKLATAIDAGDTVGNTALEGPLSPERSAALAIEPAASSVTFKAPRALTTLRIKERKK